MYAYFALDVIITIEVRSDEIKVEKNVGFVYWKNVLSNLCKKNIIFPDSKPEIKYSSFCMMYQYNIKWNVDNVMHIFNVLINLEAWNISTRKTNQKWTLRYSDGI